MPPGKSKKYNHRPSNDEYLLLKASKTGKNEEVEALLKKRVNINVKDKFGQTPLHLAYRHLDLVKLLLDNKAEVDPRDKKKYTPLWKASKKGFTDVVKELVNHGADVNLKLTDYCRSPFFVASWDGHLDVVKVLLENGARVNEPDRFGYTPLMKSSSKGHLEVIKELIKSGADVNAKNDSGHTALHFAAKENQKEAFLVLFELRADPNLPDKQGRTALDLCKGPVMRDILKPKSPETQEEETEIDSNAATESDTRKRRQQEEDSSDPKRFCVGTDDVLVDSVNKNLPNHLMIKTSNNNFGESSGSQNITIQASGNIQLQIKGSQQGSLSDCETGNGVAKEDLKNEISKPGSNVGEELEDPKDGSELPEESEVKLHGEDNSQNSEP